MPCSCLSLLLEELGQGGLGSPLISMLQKPFHEVFQAKQLKNLCGAEQGAAGLAGRGGERLVALGFGDPPRCPVKWRGGKSGRRWGFMVGLWVMGWGEANCLEMLDEAPFGAIPAASRVMGNGVSTRPTRASLSRGDEPTLVKKRVGKGFSDGVCPPGWLGAGWAPGWHPGTLLPVWGGMGNLP